jgi:hypothetical protein
LRETLFQSVDAELEPLANSGRSSPSSKAMPIKKAAMPPRAVKVSRSQRMPGTIAHAS